MTADKSTLPKTRKPTRAQLFALARAAMLGGSLRPGDRGSAADGCITDATIRALVDAGWGTTRFFRPADRWGWMWFKLSELGREVSRDEVARLEAAEQSRNARNIALEDAG